MDPENPVYKAMVCVTRCCLWCLEKYVKFIAENAYIQVAIKCESFCPAAWNAFCLMVRNVGRFSVKSAVDLMLMILGKGLIVAASAFITYAVMKGWKPEVNNPFMAVMVVALFAYTAANLFIDVFSFAAQTILHAYIIAVEDGKEKFMPEGLKQFAEDHED